jgi:hypothetical protein
MCSEPRPPGEGQATNGAGHLWWRKPIQRPSAEWVKVAKGGLASRRARSTNTDAAALVLRWREFKNAVLASRLGLGLVDVMAEREAAVFLAIVEDAG